MIAMAWEVETARATVFAPDVASLGLPSWQSITGASPLQTVTRADGIEQQSGMYGRYQLAISKQRSRADLVIGPAPRIGMSAGPISMGNLNDTMPTFKSISLKWMSPQQDVQRLALGAILWKSASSSRAALEQLVRLIPSFKLNTNDGIMDFALQINRPRESTAIPGIRINRVAIWQNATIHVIAINPAGEAPPPTPPFHRAQVTLDINTPDGASISHTQVGELLKEMQTILEEIPEKGDVP
jgi:hypothetical protein